MSRSLLEQWAARSEEERVAWLASLDDAALRDVVARAWWVTARPEQWAPPGEWNIWLILAGRGWGKTRTGGEWLIDQVLASPFDMDGIPTEWGAFAQTLPDARAVLVEGVSGLLNVIRRRRLQVEYTKAPMLLTFPQGQKIHVRGADDPDVGRGFNLAGALLDEIAKWRWSREAWTEGIMPSLRVNTASGAQPRAAVMTTPKPIPILKDWLGRTDGSVHVTRGSTFDNAKNLSEIALAELQRRYAGTRIGRQELYGELLADIEGALWKWSMIEDHRIKELPEGIVRRVVAVDPAVTFTETSDETGIVTVSMDGAGHFYIEADASVKATPDGWARAVITEYERSMADAVVVETNQGGDMHATILRTHAPNLPVRKVVASVGKKLRAEPVSALYEQGRVHHLGALADLETQMVEWVPGKGTSPDRLDALVWGITHLAFKRNVGEPQAFAT